MNHHQGTDFEERLLVRLRGVVAERDAAQAEAIKTRPARRRAPRLALGGGVAAVAVAVAMIAGAGGDNTSAAFAVEPQEGGGVDIEIYKLSDAAGLERALGEAGIPADVTYLPAGEVCRGPRYQATAFNVPGSDDGSILGAFNPDGPDGPFTIGIGGEEQRQEALGGAAGDTEGASVPNLFLNPAWFGADQTLVLTGSSSPDYRADVGVAEGPVAPCEPVPVSS